ncbi:MAG: hypothetical protein JRJ68_02345 [Deltaproteobacteria bacterium]|nr:hypothetical protein [Deltaproteobacteria bacterium]
MGMPARRFRQFGSIPGSDFSNPDRTPDTADTFHPQIRRTLGNSSAGYSAAGKKPLWQLLLSREGARGASYGRNSDHARYIPRSSSSLSPVNSRILHAVFVHIPVLAIHWVSVHMSGSRACPMIPVAVVVPAHTIIATSC